MKKAKTLFASAILALLVCMAFTPAVAGSMSAGSGSSRWVKMEDTNFELNGTVHSLVVNDADTTYSFIATYAVAPVETYTLTMEFSNDTESFSMSSVTIDSNGTYTLTASEGEIPNGTDTITLTLNNSVPAVVDTWEGDIRVISSTSMSFQAVTDLVIGMAIIMVVITVVFGMVKNLTGSLAGGSMSFKKKR